MRVSPSAVEWYCINRPPAVRQDALVKQGLTAHKADSLLENVGRRVCDVARDVQLVQRAAGRLDPPHRPRLLDVLALHAAIAKTQVSREAH